MSRFKQYNIRVYAGAGVLILSIFVAGLSFVMAQEELSQNEEAVPAAKPAVSTTTKISSGCALTLFEKITG